MFLHTLQLTVSRSEGHTIDIWWLNINIPQNKKEEKTILWNLSFVVCQYKIQIMLPLASQKQWAVFQQQLFAALNYKLLRVCNLSIIRYLINVYDKCLLRNPIITDKRSLNIQMSQVNIALCLFMAKKLVLLTLWLMFHKINISQSIRDVKFQTKYLL
jgi:hypothetical protein